MNYRIPVTEMFGFVLLLVLAIYMGAFIDKYTRIQQAEQLRINFVVMANTKEEEKPIIQSEQNKLRNNIVELFLKMIGMNEKSDHLQKGENKSEDELRNCPTGKNCSESDNSKSAPLSKKAYKSVSSLLKEYLENAPPDDIFLIASCCCMLLILLLKNCLRLQNKRAIPNELQVQCLGTLLEASKTTIENIKEMTAIVRQSEIDLDNLLEGLLNEQEDPVVKRKIKHENYYAVMDRIVENIDNTIVLPSVSVRSLDRALETRAKHQNKPWKKYCTKF